MCYNKQGDVMKKVIRIKYDSIFKYEKHKEKIQYREIGTYEKLEEKTIISFFNKDTKMEVHIEGDTIRLLHNQSQLKLIKGKRVNNKYLTAYGDIYIDTLMESFENNGNIKIKYQLLEQEEVISEVYILIQIQPVEINYEDT
jgi:uncharacterized beta-barrel protein YwiB (DUF1934 family)